MSKSKKPINGKNYGSIAHLPGSRMGPADHACHEGQKRICTETARDKHDTIIVQEKLDGSNVGVAKIDGQIIAPSRTCPPRATTGTTTNTTSDEGTIP